MDVELEVRGPWSLAASARFWEGFTPSANPDVTSDLITMAFCCDVDWAPVHARVRQREDVALVTVEGGGNLEAAARQVARILAIDVDATGWPEVGKRDPVIGEAQRALPGFRPTGFYSPYEAATWSVISQRIRIAQAAPVRRRITEQHGEGGAFPAPAVLVKVAADLDLPGRKAEYLHAVAEAALAGRLAGDHLRSMPADQAAAEVQQILGLGPFAAGLVVLRGANHPDGRATGESRLMSEIARLYGADADPITVMDGWAPYRTWGAVHLRALREARTSEISG